MLEIKIEDDGNVETKGRGSNIQSIKDLLVLRSVCDLLENRLKDKFNLFAEEFLECNEEDAKKCTDKLFNDIKKDFASIMVDMEAMKNESK